MKKLCVLVLCSCFFVGCGLYGTTKYSVNLDAQQADLRDIEHLKKVSSCTFLLLGFIPWPWHPNKTPGTLFEAMKQGNMQKVIWLDSTYNYKFTYADKCQNAYGY